MNSADVFMGKRKSIKHRPQCIVLPFQPHPAEDFNGVGLALHFLLGNVMVLHNGLKECWFGWKAKKIFPEKTNLQAYCKGKDVLADLRQLSTAQNVRFWLYGTATLQYVAVCLFDAADKKQNPSKNIPFFDSDGLVQFRRMFLDYLATCGHPFPAKQLQLALWPETISMQGLEMVGLALESFYLHSAYGQGRNLDLNLFEKAVDVAPNAFMAQNLLGWAFYRNNDYDAAKASFLRALQSNPNGIGAMSGLMWCGVYTGDRTAAQFWAARKAGVRGEDAQKARQNALGRIK